MNPSNFVPAIHFQSIYRRCATPDDFSPTICDHEKKTIFFKTMSEGSNIARQLENVAHVHAWQEEGCSKCFILQRSKKGFLSEIGREMSDMNVGGWGNGRWIRVFQVDTKKQ